jgi:hypothetical protein
MGGTPISLDFSKAQPLPNAAAQPGAFQSAKGAPVQNANVQLDFSKAQPIPQAGEQQNYAGLKEIVPMEGESFGDTMKRAIEYGKTVTPEQLHQQAQADLKLAPAVAAAAPAIGAAGAAAIAGPATLGSVLSAPTAATGSVGTGILDAAGNEFMKNVTTYGPSLLKQYGAKAALPLVRYALRGAGIGAAYKTLDWVSKNL